MSTAGDVGCKDRLAHHRKKGRVGAGSSRELTSPRRRKWGERERIGEKVEWDLP